MSTVVQILTTGSAALGMGHLRRSETLARRLATRHVVKVGLLTGSASPGPAAGAELFRGLSCETGVWPCDRGADVVVLDLPVANQPAAMAKLHEVGARVCALDYFVTELLPETAINLMDVDGQMAAAFARARRLADFREGPSYALIRPALLDRRPAFVAGWERRPQRIVITMGGADPSRQTLAAVQALCPLVHGDATVDVVLGALAPADLEKEVRIAADGWRVHRAPANFDELLAASDLVLCSGGGTLLEALCLGKPAVVFPQNHAESRHAQRYLDAGACLPRARLAEAMRQPRIASTIAARGWTMVDGRGLSRVADCISEMAAFKCSA